MASIKRGLGYQPLRFDVIIKCGCGRHVLIYTVEHPGHDSRYRCKVCGRLGVAEVWPIWVRGGRGDPRDIPGIEMPMGHG